MNKYIGVVASGMAFLASFHGAQGQSDRYWDVAGTAPAWTANASTGIATNDGWTSDAAGVNGAALGSGDNIFFSSTAVTTNSTVTIGSFVSATVGDISKTTSVGTLTISTNGTNTLTTTTGNISVTAGTLDNRNLLDVSTSDTLSKTGGGIFTQVATVTGISGLVVSGGIFNTDRNRLPNTVLLTVDSGAIFRMSGSSTSGGILGQTISGLVGNGTVEASANSPILILTSNSTDRAFGGTLSQINTGSLALTKNGSYSQTLSGTGSYSGATTVTAGTLIIDGNFSAATGAVTVASGAVLGGTGTIGGNVTISSGGNLNPAGNGTGTLTFNTTNSLALSGNTNMQVTSAANFDSINNIGALTLGGALNIALTGTYVSQSWDLFNFASKSSNFASVNLTGSYTGSLTRSGELWTGTVGGKDFQFSQVNGVLTAIPEPSTWLLLGCGLIAVLIHQGRRARKS